jgi:hypothetical protein
VLLRLTVALVLAGLGLLLAGVVRDTLGLIYLSILCTAIAGVALIVYVQVSRRQEARLATEDDPGGDEGTGASPAPAAEGGRGDPFGANPESATDQSQLGAPPGTASGEETPPGS